MISNWFASATDDVYLRHTTNEVLHLNLDTPGSVQSNPNAVIVGAFHWYGGFLGAAIRLVRRDNSNLVLTGGGSIRTHDNGANFAIGGRVAAGGAYDGEIEHVRIMNKESSHNEKDTIGRNMIEGHTLFFSVGAEQPA